MIYCREQTQRRTERHLLNHCTLHLSLSLSLSLSFTGSHSRRPHSLTHSLSRPLTRLLACLLAPSRVRGWLAGWLGALLRGHGDIVQVLSHAFICAERFSGFTPSVFTPHDVVLYNGSTETGNSLQFRISKHSLKRKVARESLNAVRSDNHRASLHSGPKAT